MHCPAYKKCMPLALYMYMYWYRYMHGQNRACIVHVYLVQCNLNYPDPFVYRLIAAIPDK